MAKTSASYGASSFSLPKGTASKSRAQRSADSAASVENQAFARGSDHSARESVSSGFDDAHIMHQECVVQWLQENDRCPVCNQLMTEQITSDEVRQLLTTSPSPGLQLIHKLINKDVQSEILAETYKGVLARQDGSASAGGTTRLEVHNEFQIRHHLSEKHDESSKRESDRRFYTFNNDETADQASKIKTTISNCEARNKRYLEIQKNAAVACSQEVSYKNLGTQDVLRKSKTTMHKESTSKMESSTSLQEKDYLGRQTSGNAETDDLDVMSTLKKSSI